MRKPRFRVRFPLLVITNLPTEQLPKDTRVCRHSLAPATYRIHLHSMTMARQADDPTTRKACRSCATAKVRCAWLRSEAAASRMKAPACDRYKIPEHSRITCYINTDKPPRCLRLKKSCTTQASSVRVAPVPRTQVFQPVFRIC